MRALFLLFLLLFSSINVNATESCCVDEDVAEAFIPYATFSRSWPSEFPDIVSPSNFEFIGSSEGKDGRYVSVAWSTAMDVQLAHEAAAEALVDQDWLPLPENEGMQVRFERGFIPPRSLLNAGNRRFCRDQDGLLTIQTRSTSIGTVVTLSLSGQDHMSTCARAVASQAMQPGITGGLMMYLPTDGVFRRGRIAASYAS